MAENQDNKTYINKYKHVTKMANERLPKLILHYKPREEREPGTPRRKLEDLLRNYFR